MGVVGKGWVRITAAIQRWSTFRKGSPLPSQLLLRTRLGAELPPSVRRASAHTTAVHRSMIDRNQDAQSVDGSHGAASANTASADDGIEPTSCLRGSSDIRVA